MTFEQITKGRIALALSNIAPLLGVLLGYWSAFDVIFLYWFENIIIGLFTVCRMTIRPENSTLFAIGGLFTAGFFCLHYGFFTYGHGVFVASFFEEQLLSGSNNTNSNLIQVIGHMLSNQGVQLTIAAMFIAHLIDYIIDYREKRVNAITDEMFKPYKRIIVLHIAIIFGGFIAMSLNNSLGVALVMIALKVFFDLKPPKFAQRKTSKFSKGLSDDEAREKIRQELVRPKIKVNGRIYQFDSVGDMVNSDVYKKYSKWVRWVLPKKHWALYQEVLAERIQEERQSAS